MLIFLKCKTNENEASSCIACLAYFHINRTIVNVCYIRLYCIEIAQYALRSLFNFPHYYWHLALNKTRRKASKFPIFLSIITSTGPLNLNLSLIIK